MLLPRLLFPGKVSSFAGRMPGENPYTLAASTIAIVIAYLLFVLLVLVLFSL